MIVESWISAVYVLFWFMVAYSSDISFMVDEATEV